MKRIKQLEKISDNVDSFNSVWFGGLFFPEAFLTVTRQYFSKIKNLPLEELELILHVRDLNEKHTIKLSGNTFYNTNRRYY